MKIDPNFGRLRFKGKHIGGWQWEGRSEPVFSRLRSAFDDSLRIAVSIDERRGELSKNPELTPKGVTAELERWAKQNTFRPLSKARRVTIPAAKRELADGLAGLTFEGADRTDAVGAMVRMQIRDQLRSMDTKARAAAIKDASPEVALAVVEAPAFVSGINASAHERLMTKAIEAAYPGESERLGQLQKAIETVERAFGAALGELIPVTNLGQARMMQMLDGLDLGAENPPLLKRNGSDVVVLYADPSGTLKSRPATAEDVAIGHWHQEGAEVHAELAELAGAA